MQENDDDYHVFRWMVRARVNPSVVTGIARAWFHFHVATHGSVEGHENRRRTVSHATRARTTRPATATAATSR